MNSMIGLIIWFGTASIAFAILEWRDLAIAAILAGALIAAVNCLAENEEESEAS